MDILIWVGASVTLGGLALLIWCIIRLFNVRRSGLEDDAMRTALERLVPLNTGALLMSIVGLMLVVVGILLG